VGLGPGPQLDLAALNIVANDGRVLAKLADGGGANIATLDKFVVYLREPATGLNAVIPPEAAELLAASATSPSRCPSRTPPRCSARCSSLFAPATRFS
jgi:hypothetical protein